MRFNLHTNSFEEISSNTNKLAIVGSDIDITWQELKTSVEELSNQLQLLGIPKGHPVIIYGHKESYFIVAMLACMINDIPYIPVDILVPLERIKKIKEITGSLVLIDCSNNTSHDFNFEIKFQQSKIVNKVSTDFSNSIYYNQKDPIRYIMFTSGSTGEPKGVQITREAILSFSDWLKTDYGFNEFDIYLNQAPFSFDVSLFDTYLFLQYGSTVVLTSNEVGKNPDLFIERLIKYQCTVWTSTPSFAYMYMMDPRFNCNKLPTLKTFLFAGEILPKRTVNYLLNNFSKARVLNSYGPTEATVTTTLIDVTKEILEKYSSIPIGFVKAGNSIAIEPDKGETESGEIIIIGEHVSIGYFKNELLNTHKFLTINEKRAFKTGDLGFIKDNLVFFMGRNDDQIKLHGFRIELGDITTQLESLDFISEACTIALKRGDVVQKIVSFVLLKSNEVDFELNAKKQLQISLPHYMIPAEIIALKEFPINSNHKIDKRKLEEMYRNRI